MLVRTGMSCAGRVGLLEPCEGGAEFVDGGIGDGLAHRLVDLLLHVRRQLVHSAGRHGRAARPRAPGHVMLLTPSHTG